MRSPFTSSSPSHTETVIQRLDDPLALHTVFILDDIAAGAEQGMIIPPAGQDQKWADEHLDEVRERAAAGEKSMQRFEREIGWGFGNEWAMWRIGVGGWEKDEMERRREGREGQQDSAIRGQEGGERHMEVDPGLQGFGQTRQTPQVVIFSSEGTQGTTD
jgi:hypothetical protein